MGCCHRGACEGVPACKCNCPGCLDEWDRFSFVQRPHDDTCDCDSCCGDDVDCEEA